MVTTADCSTGDSTDVYCYICPNDLMVLDQNVLKDIDPDFIIHDVSIPVQYWPELYIDEPHKVPNYYPSAPMKLEYKNVPFVKPILRRKIFDSRSGLKGTTTRRKMGRV